MQPLLHISIQLQAEDLFCLVNEHFIKTKSSVALTIYKQTTMQSMERERERDR